MEYEFVPQALVDAVDGNGADWRDGIDDVEDSPAKRMLEAMWLIHVDTVNGLAFDNPETVLALADDWLSDFEGDDAVEWLAARILTPAMAMQLEGAGHTPQVLMGDGDEPRRTAEGLPIGLLLSAEMIGLDNPLVTADA